VTIQHQTLAGGRWQKIPLSEQMTHIGSEVSRALNWQKKGRKDFSEKAASRALELLDLSLDAVRPFSRLREVARLREAVADYFFGDNAFGSTESLWRNYFDHFHYYRQNSKLY
jgi:hypothetical protein